MMDRRSKITGLYVAAAIFAVTTVYGVKDIIVSPSSLLRQERYLTAEALAEVRYRLERDYSLRDLATNYYVSELVEDGFELMAREKSLELRLEEIENNPQYTSEQTKSSIQSVGFAFSFLGFLVSYSLIMADRIYRKP